MIIEKQTEAVKERLKDSMNDHAGGFQLDSIFLSKHHASCLIFLLACAAALVARSSVLNWKELRLKMKRLLCEIHCPYIRFEERLHRNDTNDVQDACIRRIPNERALPKTTAKYMRSSEYSLPSAKQFEPNATALRE